MTQPIPAMLAVAVEAACAAGDLIRTAAANPGSRQIREKHPNDFVTEVDLASERLIVQTLLAAWPQHAVRGEESGALHGNAAAESVWIVDPLDGTTNFIHGYPAYAVSIALVHRGQLQIGVVLDVAQGRLFSATLGGGAFCDGRRLKVAERRRLAGAMVASSCSPTLGPGGDAPTGLRMLGNVVQRCAALRRSGSVALDLAQVAAGRCDASFDIGPAVWDVAAGTLLVREAGGEVSDFLGAADCLEARECVAGNAALRAELCGLVGPFAWPRPPSTLPRH